LWLLKDLLSLKTHINVHTVKKEISNKHRKRNYLFCWDLESHWGKEQDLDPNPHPDPDSKSDCTDLRAGSAAKCHGSATPVFTEEAGISESWQT
jgi:hypothetical protein